MWPKRWALPPNFLFKHRKGELRIYHAKSNSAQTYTGTTGLIGL